MPQALERIVVVTKKTALEELIERFNTREQARFYLEHLGESFEEYDQAHETYVSALQLLKRALPQRVRTQFLERDIVPTYQFGPYDLVVVLGPDGLVVNVAKYLRGQTVVAFNPDPQRIDGVLLPFYIAEAPAVLAAAARQQLRTRNVTMAQAELEDGQRLLAVNDLFIGASSHVSARYRLKWGRHEEAQISSGVIVSTGAGSTGWRRSIVCGALHLAGLCSGTPTETIPADLYQFALDERRLAFCVREPFPSRVSGIEIAAGKIEHQDVLEVTSQMPQKGVIFGDGVENDYLEFNAGMTARISVAPETLRLAVH